jgi:hypothetical protein
MQISRTNPYFNLKPIHKPIHSSDTLDMFYGRINLLERFFAAIANHQSVSLVGSQHIGKTSFLLRASQPEVQQHFEIDASQFLFVYLDLRKYLRKTCEDFFRAVSEAIIARYPDLPGLKLRAERDGEDEFGRILELLCEHGFFPVLLLDAFDNITRNKHFDAEFLAYLRALATAGKVSYVTASVAPLSEVCHRGIVDSPFFNIFYNYPLGPLTFEEAQDLITIPAEKVGLPFTKSEIALILQLAGRHPFFIQRVCHCVFEEKLSQSNGDEQDLRKLAYDDLQPHFNDTWERLSEAQKRMLQEEAQKQQRSQSKLLELSESDLFRQFVRLTCGAELFTLTLDELENALEKLDDAKALGETNLRLLNLVSRHQKKISSSSAVEIGLIIRSVLNEAFERLRGPLVRSDMDPALQSYNILYYRYFKYHHKNEQIAARIGFSPRQYFRYRKKAIDALLNILFEMESASSSNE